MEHWINGTQSETKTPKLSSGEVKGGKNSDENAAPTLLELVQKSCLGEAVDPQRVIDELLNVEDEQEVLDGRMVPEELAFFIKLWISSGMEKLSGK